MSLNRVREEEADGYVTNPRLRSLPAILGMFLAVFVLAPTLAAQGNRIPSTTAVSAGCSDASLGGVDIVFNGHTFHLTDKSPRRLDPEWAVIITDSNKSILAQPLQVAEGFVTPTQDNEQDTNQAHAEVSEEEIAWTHYTHDFTFKLTPDSPYQNLLSYYANPDGSIGYQPDMEVEWDNASLMDEHEGFQRIWGAMPEFVSPAVDDRVWALGRWIFDCGHPGVNSDDKKPYVRFETEIHPPRALVTYRLYHPALDSFPRARTSEPNYPNPQSYLPVTGEPQSGQSLSPTQVPLTEADIFVSGNGGGANDLCSLVPAVGDLLDGPTTCGSGHTNPVIPVNDSNYVFDIYPPVTDYQLPDTSGGKYTIINGNKVYPFTVFPPTPDASLQYRIIDHSGELPAHACGGNDTSGCATVTPIICLIDDTTPPPDQSETACPAVPQRPTRLRVILPFKGTNANFFAQSILLGWDDVPTPDNNSNLPVRTFKVTLHKFTVDSDGAGCCNDGDWRVFLNVGGQWRYISPFFDTNAFGGRGIKAFDGGDNVCDGDALTENGDGNCFQFDNTPWIVSIGQQQPIHVGVGGFIARDVENTGDPAPASLCRNYPGGCDPDYSIGQFLDLELDNDDRIGTYEFDLTNFGNYQRPNTFQIASFDCTVFAFTGCDIQYTTDFRVEELDPGTAPASDAPQLGDPHYNTFVTSATPITLSSSDPSAQGFQYRFHLQGGSLPTYTSSVPFPVHWANANFSNGQSLQVYLNGASAMGDGAYDFQYSANSTADLLEPRHTKTVTLDNTSPVATINQPAATQYGHNATLTLDYSVSDGSGSGVKSFTPKMDGQTALQFCNSLTCLDSGQPIYLYSMSLGPHTFSVDSVDNLGNAGTYSVTFTVTVTFDSLKGDVNDLVSLGCIDNITQSLLSKISAAQNLNGKGQTQAAINTLFALINEIQAQAGKHISTTCTDPSGRPFNPVQLLIGDIQYLQGILGQLKPNPVIGSVLNSNNVGINGVNVNLVNSSKTVIAAATTDSAGFFYFADTSGLTMGANYTVKVTLPKGYKSSTPASQAFTWKAVGATLSNFALN